MTTDYYDIGGSVTFTSVFDSILCVDSIISKCTQITDNWCSSCTLPKVSLTQTHSVLDEPTKVVILKGIMPVKLPFEGFKVVYAETGSEIKNPPMTY